VNFVLMLNGGERKVGKDVGEVMRGI